MARSIEQWLAAYGESHQNKTNKLIHWICVPVITWTVLALMWLVQVPGLPWLNLAMAFILFALGFYWRLARSIAIGMALFSAICLGIILWHEATLVTPLWQSALALFVAAWLVQFIGHKIEGKKPSFFEDLQFLLIGPAWLLSFIYRRQGISLR